MATVVVTGFEASASTPGATVILDGFEVYGEGSSAKVRFSDFQVFAVSLGATVVLDGFEAYAVNTTVAAIMSGPTSAEPLDTVVLSLASSTGTPDAWNIVQIPDPAGRVPTIPLVMAGDHATFTAPVIFPDEVNWPNDLPFVATFRGTVSKSAGTPSSMDFNVTIFPHLCWMWSPGPPYVRVPVFYAIP